jgi:hypothetical protein
MANIEYSRLLMKRSMTAGVVPTVPLTNNLNDFNATDIFEGELFYNVADGILYSRDLTGIVILATGVVPVNPDLTTVLGIGNNTGPFDIIIDTDQVVRNPLALTPLESTLSFGTSAVPGVSDNHIELVSQDNSVGQLSSLILQSQDPSNIANAQLTLLDGLGSIVSIGINTDFLGGCQPLTAFDAGTNAAFVHNLTPAGAFHGFNCTNAVSQAAVWNQQPTQLDWTINDPIANLSVTEVNDYITGSRRDVTSTGFTNYIEQDYGGTITLSASKGIVLDTLAPGGSIYMDVASNTTIDSPIIAFANNNTFSIDTLPAFADDAAAALGGLVTNRVYQTDGTGAAPLNVPGIVMIKQ